MPELTPPEQQLYALRESLAATYGKIEERALGIVRSGEAAENPVLTGEKKDTRYSISVIGRLSGEGDEFLEKATLAIREVEPELNFLPKGFRHVTLREVIFADSGRRSASVNASRAKEYYRALRVGFHQAGKPIELEIVKLLPTIDREQNSVSVVAALLPKNLVIADVRQRVSQSIEDAKLPLVARLGDIKVIFVNLGRLPYPPRMCEETFPLLDALAQLNVQTPDRPEVVIDALDVISTTPISYPNVSKHVYLNPPISLVSTNEQVIPVFVKPYPKPPK